MHKIDSSGATVDNKFTEGNPALGVPATVVSAAICNAWQEEIVNVIVSLGMTLLTSTTDTFTQLLDAISRLIVRGGRISPVIQSILNGQSSPADVTNFPVWLSTEVVALKFFFNSFRRTDSGSENQSGEVYLSWNSEDSTWDVTKAGFHDDSEINFAVAVTGNPNEFKLRYTTDSMAGANYAGSLRITDIKQIRVS